MTCEQALQDQADYIWACQSLQESLRARPTPHAGDEPQSFSICARVTGPAPGRVTKRVFTMIQVQSHSRLPVQGVCQQKQHKQVPAAAGWVLNAVSGLGAANCPGRGAGLRSTCQCPRAWTPLPGLPSFLISHSGIVQPGLEWGNDDSSKALHPFCSGS